MTYLQIPGGDAAATNYERVFTLAPEAYQHWGALSSR